MKCFPNVMKILSAVIELLEYFHSQITAGLQDYQPVCVPPNNFERIGGV
jgi:hypothetical protein